MTGWVDRVPEVRVRFPLHKAREVLGPWLREDRFGRLWLRQAGPWSGVWRAASVAEVIETANRVLRRQYRRDALRRARELLRTRLVVEMVEGRERTLLDGRFASLARIVEVGRQIDRSGWPAEPKDLPYPVVSS